LLPGILFKSAGLFVVPSTKTNILKNPYIATMETMPKPYIMIWPLHISKWAMMLHCRLCMDQAESPKKDFLYLICPQIGAN